MTLYCGIDLHANNSVVSVLDDQDQVRFEKRLPNDLELIKASLEAYREELLACVVESTYNGYWLVDGLMEDGFERPPGTHRRYRAVQRHQAPQRRNGRASSGPSATSGHPARGPHHAQGTAWRA